MASRHAQTYAHIEDIRVERKRKGFLLRLDTKHHADGEQEEGGERREQKEQQENRSRFVQEKCKRRKKGYVFSASYRLRHVYVLYGSVYANVFWQGI